MFNNFFLRMQAKLALHFKIKEADARFHSDGERRFLICLADGHLAVLTLDEALSMKHLGNLPADFTAKTIYGCAIYFTGTNRPTARTKTAMPKVEVRRRRDIAFIPWFIKHHTKSRKS